MAAIDVAPSRRRRLSAREFVFNRADRFLPPSQGGAELTGSEALRLRTGIVIAWLGVICASCTGTLYVYLGSPISGIAIAGVAVPLLFLHLAVRRGLSLTILGNIFTTGAWLMTFVVAARTGGFQSPALVWSFIHPITTYVACGKRSAQIWAVLCTSQVGVFFVFEQVGVHFTEDLALTTVTVLRAVGFVGCILTNIGLIAAIEGVRVASQEAMDQANRTIERERILGDMHDGVGSQLLGLIIQVRARKIDDQDLLHGLTNCLDDIRLIVDSLDPIERSFNVAMGEFRSRLEPKCSAAGITLDWALDPALPLSPEQTLQVLRAVQEMTTNAIRHSRTTALSVTMRAEASSRRAAIIVRDYGTGIDESMPRRTGRGMTSLRTRAQRLGGAISIEPAAPGTRVTLRFPLAG